MILLSVRSTADAARTALMDESSIGRSRNASRCLAQIDGMATMYSARSILTQTAGTSFFCHSLVRAFAGPALFDSDADFALIPLQIVLLPREGSKRRVESTVLQRFVVTSRCLTHYPSSPDATTSPLCGRDLRERQASPGRPVAVAVLRARETREFPGRVPPPRLLPGSHCRIQSQERLAGQSR